jgi:hypothetical protein
MRRVLFLIVFCALCAHSAVAREPVLTASDLMDLCAGTDTTSKNVCRIYILGVTQGIALGLNIADGKTRSGRPCIPDNLSGEALEVRVKEKLREDLKASPADRSLDASSFVGRVIASVFTCAKPQHQ